MNLGKKKELAARTLKVGKGRIVLIKERINEIKEAITKQDIRVLKNDGAIIIKEIKGRKKKQKKKTKRGPGKIKKKVKTRKKTYTILTRKLRKSLAGSRKREKISREELQDVRKKIRNRFFRSQSHLKNYLKEK